MSDRLRVVLTDSVMRGELALSVMSESLALADDDTGDLEHLIRTRQVALDKELLQLVQGACKADNLQRALDITRLMHNSATVDAAAKVAAFYHLPGLQERIADVKHEIEYKRIKERRARRAMAAYHGSTPDGREQVSSKGFTDFAPKTARRSFGGVPPGTGSGAGLRDTTPALSGRSMETFIPETPEAGGRIMETPAPENDRPVSPEGKRRRDVETPVEEFVAPRKRVEDFPASNGRCFILIAISRSLGGRLHSYEPDTDY